MRKHKLSQLIIEIIEDHFCKKLEYLDQEIKYDRYIAHFTDGTEEIVTYEWILAKIEELMNRKV